MSVTVPAGCESGRWPPAHGATETKGYEMLRMSDGSEVLPVGTYVLVTEKRKNAENPYVAQVVGTDMGFSKYELGRRYTGWSDWRFLDGGSWAFPGEVRRISKEGAMPQACRNCGRAFFMAYVANQPIWVDYWPDPEGELVLRGDPLDLPADEFVAAFYNVSPEGDDFFGVPAGAPRYRRHECP